MGSHIERKKKLQISGSRAKGEAKGCDWTSSSSGTFFFNGETYRDSAFLLVASLGVNLQSFPLCKSNFLINNFSFADVDEILNEGPGSYLRDK